MSVDRLLRHLPLCLIALPALLTGACRSEPEPRVESVVVIVVDTLRADHLGIYNPSLETSANLDRRAANGVLFERALAPSPWTLPTAGSILTGLYPSRHGAGLRVDPQASPAPADDGATEESPTTPVDGIKVRDLGSFTRLSDEVPTVAERFAAAGFDTRATVSNAFLRAEFGFSRGFETFDQQEEALAGRTAGEVIDGVIGWLDEAGERPFFWLVHLYDPHLPYAAPAPFGGRFSAGYSGALESPVRSVRRVRDQIDRLDEDDRAFIEATYNEEIAYTDDALERLFVALENAGKLESTLVVLTSDHGEEFFEHGGFEHGHSVYQELLHVPLILWAPGVPPARLDEPVSLVDLAPTLLEAVGEPAERGLDGHSLWPAVQATDEILRRPIAAERTLYGAEQRAVVAWPYKLILSGEFEPLFLFDLATDPQEREDLLDSQPDVAASLAGAAVILLSGSADQEEVELSPEVEKQLRALGYLGD